MQRCSTWLRYFWQISCPSGVSRSNLSKLLCRSWLEQMTACSSCVNRLEVRNSSISEAGREGAVAARMRVEDSRRSDYWSSWCWGRCGEESLREEGEQLGAEWSSEKEGNYSIGFNIIIMMDFHPQKTSSHNHEHSGEEITRAAATATAGLAARRRLGGSPGCGCLCEGWGLVFRAAGGPVGRPASAIT